MVVVWGYQPAPSDRCPTLQIQWASVKTLSKSQRLCLHFPGPATITPSPLSARQAASRESELSADESHRNKRQALRYVASTIAASSSPRSLATSFRMIGIYAGSLAVLPASACADTTPADCKSVTGSRHGESVSTTSLSKGTSGTSFPIFGVSTRPANKGYG
jgi:hypothetical protein